MKLLTNSQKPHVIHLIVALFVLLFFLPSVITSSASDNFRSLDFQSDGPLIMEENWLFVWDELLSLEEARSRYINDSDLTSMGYWHKHDVNGSQGTATYYKQLTIQQEAVGKKLGLYLPDIATSYRLWINGEPVHEQGTVSLEADSSVPSVMPVIKQVVSEDETIEIMMHISNHHFQEGGPLGSMYIGPFEDISRQTQMQSVMEIILFGVLLLSAGHHLVIFLLRRKDRENLYFSLFCMLMAIRVVVTGQKMAFQLFPDFSWMTGFHLEYLSYYLGAGVLLLYIHQLFKDHASSLMTFTLTAITGMFSIFVIATPIQVFTESLLYFQLYTAILFTYAFWIILRAARDGVQGAFLTVILFAIFGLTVINDILFHYHVLNTILLAPMGMVFLIFGQTTILTMRKINAYREVEELSEKQREWHWHLENEVENRTNELKGAMNRLKVLSEVDGLTGIPNRRLFDEHIELDLIRAYKENQGISLLMIDIDNYKNYNDLYGHLQGDDCLKSVANMLKETVKEETKGEVYRYGGEEFAVLLPDMDQEEASELAERLRSVVENAAIPHEDSPVHDWITVSIGGKTMATGQTLSITEFIQAADAALYEAKRTGKNKVVMRT